MPNTIQLVIERRCNGQIGSKARAVQVLEELKPLGKEGPRNGSRPRKSAKEEPLELRMALRGVLFKMDHHPLEVSRTAV